MKDKMGWEYVAYVILNIFTFGSFWMMKVIIKKAILETQK
jgi:hypothetical protein